MNVTIYSKTICPYCERAKMFLKQRNIEYTEVKLDDDQTRTEFYEKCGPGVRSVPQIFVDGERLGDYNDLIKSDIVQRAQAGKFNEDF